LDSFADLVDQRVDRAQSLAAAISALPGAEIVNQVVSTSICLSFGTDNRTREVAAALADQQTVKFRGRTVLHISTLAGADPAATLAALRNAVEVSAPS
jgi:glutamate/tyrosine decarboxylase-like PLP-dependent enzyme